MRNNLNLPPNFAGKKLIHKQQVKINLASASYSFVHFFAFGERLEPEISFQVFMEDANPLVPSFKIQLHENSPTFEEMELEP